MLNYYLKTALRNIKKNKIFSAINIFGLAIGMAVCILIMLYVSYEYSYDKFHDNYENIYRVQFNIYHHEELKVECAAAVPAVGPAMKENFPEVLEYCRAFPASGIISSGDKSFREEDIQVVGPSFITMLSFPLIKGDTETALSGPHKAVITESTAKKFFGDEDPLGKTITWNGDIEFEVTGICIDVPDNSHIKFTVLVSHDTIREFWGEAVDTAWGWYDFNTYVLLADGTDHKVFDKKFDEYLLKELGEMFEKRDARFKFPLQPIKSIHLYSDLLQESEPAENGDGTAVKFLTLIAFFILVIAWVNYINLSTSKAMERAKEVGIRKVSGANKKNLVRQFLSESYLINIISIVIALILVAVLLPVFKQLVGTKISISYLFTSGLWLWIVILFIGGSLLSGLYPAFVLSSFKPISVLKGSFYHTTRGNLLRKVFVIFQFTISVILIAGAIIVFSQLNYIRNRKLGISIDQTLVLKGPGVYTTDSLATMCIESFKQETISLADVSSFTASSCVPGVEIFWGQGSRSEDQSEEFSEVMYLMGMDHDFISSYDLDFIAGENFTPGLRENMTEALVNLSAVKRYGYSAPEDIIGKNIYISNDTLLVKGVIEDFNQMSLKTNIIPLAFPFLYASDKYFSIKLSGAHIHQTINSIKEKWEEILPGNPFEFFFLDEHFDNQYRKDIQFGKVFGIFTVLAIFIACLGLFALSSFSALKRSKEIGIRKVLGASSSSIVRLLSRNFLTLIIISIIIAVPITYFLMKLWLQSFAYRIIISWDVFALSTLIVAVIATVTISFQTMKAANSNPVDSIKYE